MLFLARAFMGLASGAIAGPASALLFNYNRRAGAVTFDAAIIENKRRTIITLPALIHEFPELFFLISMGINC